MLRALLGAFALGLAVSITLAQLALAVLALRWVYRLVTGAARPTGWPLAAPFVAWAAASLLAVALAARPFGSLVEAKSLLLIITFYVLLDALPDAARADQFLFGLFALIAALAVLAVLQVALCPWLAPLEPSLGRIAKRCDRAHAFYSIWMTLAGVLSLVLLAVLPRLLPPAAPPGERVTAWRIGGWLVGGLALALTYVRGAWIGFGAGIALLLTLVRRGRLVVVAGVVMLALAVALVPGLRQRAESFADPTDPTVQDRWTMWESGLAIARDHLVTGVGPGQLKHVYPAYKPPDAKPRGHLHNTPLQILVERGVLGLAAWGWIFLAFFWRLGEGLRRLPPEATRTRALATGSLAAIAGFLVGGLTDYNFGDSEVAMVAYSVMAVGMVAVRSRPARKV